MIPSARSFKTWLSRKPLLSLLLSGAACYGWGASAFAQAPGASIGQRQYYYQPVHQNMSPGVAGYWAGLQGKATPPYFQPVRVEVPTKAQVTVYHGPSFTPYDLDASRPFACLVGYVYRLRIAGMPEYPGVELYPTIEVLDRLHPPPGKELDFPIPIQFTEREILAAMDGQMVTKVIFLEQPQLAPPREQTYPIPTPELPTAVNILAEADRVGRPMAILRLGSRLPGANGTDPSFFGMGAPVYIPPKEAEQPPANTPRN